MTTETITFERTGQLILCVSKTKNSKCADSESTREVGSRDHQTSRFPGVHINLVRKNIVPLLLADVHNICTCNSNLPPAPGEGKIYVEVSAVSRVRVPGLNSVCVKLLFYF